MQDGHLDIYVTNTYQYPNILYKNDGSCGFTDVASSAGVDVGVSSNGGIWGDYDADGDVDLFVVNAEAYNDDGSAANGGENMLFQNQNDGTFLDVTSSAGVGDLNNARAAIFGDFDSDGDFDIYVSCRDASNQLYVSHGDGVFEEIAASAGVDQSAYGQGVAAGDYDGDGDLDLCVCCGVRCQDGKIDCWCCAAQVHRLLQR